MLDAFNSTRLLWSRHYETTYRNKKTISITLKLFSRNILTIFCNDTFLCKLFYAFCNRYIMSSLICLILLSTFTFTHAPIIQLLISATSSLMSTIYLIASFLGDLTLHKVHLTIRLVISCLSLPISMAKVYLPSFALMWIFVSPWLVLSSLLAYFYNNMWYWYKDHTKCNKLGTLSILYDR